MLVGLFSDVQCGDLVTGNEGMVIINWQTSERIKRRHKFRQPRINAGRDAMLETVQLFAQVPKENTKLFEDGVGVVNKQRRNYTRVWFPPARKTKLLGELATSKKLRHCFLIFFSMHFIVCRVSLRLRISYQRLSYTLVAFTEEHGGRGVACFMLLGQLEPRLFKLPQSHVFSRTRPSLTRWPT